jgi:putative hydrolase of the HAD superfamily
VGIHAIHVPDKGGWSFDQADLNIPVRGRFHTLETISHVPQIIREHVKDLKERR